jgi:hypothetical protein
MKIRMGFVSNSSSSSFCIYGVCLKDHNLQEILISKGVKEEYLEEGSYDYLDDWSFKYRLKDKGMSEEDIKKECEKKLLTGIEHHDPMGEGDIYIGRAWCDIKDDETGKQFKERIEKELKDALGEDIKVGTHEEAWRDG